MIVGGKYSHFKAESYLLSDRKIEYDEILDVIRSVDANQYLKVSCDVSRIGRVFYSQSLINKAIKDGFKKKGWNPGKRTPYVVTGDVDVTKKIMKLSKERQIKAIKEIEEKKGTTIPYYSTYNEVDFTKEKIGLEVQFGKYFSVAYDIHVKHQFFSELEEIEVGVEVIPTKKMEQCMDTGVPYYENEMTNIVREGKSSTSLSILLLGIEPENIVSTNPLNYSDDDYKALIISSDPAKLRTQVDKIKAGKTSVNPDKKRDILDKIERCLP